MIYRILNIELLQTLKLKWYLMDSNRNKFSYVTELPFKDYFFVTQNMIEPLKTQFPDTEFEISETDYHFAKFKDRNEKAYKVEINNPYTKTNVRIVMEEEHDMLISEGDINYVDLVMKDMDIRDYVTIKDGIVLRADDPDDFPELRVAFYDIETDDRPHILQKSEYEQFAKVDTARILSASICDGQTGEIKHFVHDDEETLLKQIADELNNYEIIQAWNGLEFDFLYFKRFTNITGFNHKMFILLDAMKIHEMLNPKERNFVSLDMAGQRYLDIRKIQHAWGFYEAWDKHRDELEVYNNRDVELMYKLEEKFGFSGIVMQTASQIGFLPQRYTYSRYSSIIAIMKMSLDHYGKRIVWKSKSVIPIDEAYEGAVVLDSVKGRHKHVVGIDLASLYNNIIQTWNISPEQLVIYEDGSHDYSRYDHEGLMARALRVFEIDRNKYKVLRNNSEGDEYRLYDQIQSGLKIILLSIYGGLGARGSTRAKESGKPSGAKSFYSWHCANDVTYYARSIILLAKKVVEERLGFEVVYGDTDSLYISLGDMDLDVDAVKTILQTIVDATNEEYAVYLDKFNIPTENRKIEMEAQGYYSPFVLFGKKKYYFAKEVYNAENNFINEELVMYAKGIKAIKLSEPIFVREFQRQLYSMILEYKPLKEVEKFLIEIEQKFHNGEFDDKLVFETKLAKPISEYTNYSMHTLLAKQLIEQGKMQEKSTLFYVVTHTEFGKGVAKLEGSPITRSGRTYVWEKRVEKWVSEIMDMIFYDNMQTGLDDFF